MLLLELFDSNSEFTWTSHGKWDDFAEFTVGGEPFEVQFSYDANEDVYRAWNITFSQVNDWGLKAKHNMAAQAPKVFAMVLAATRQFIKRRNPEKLVITGTKVEGRYDLYTHMARRLAMEISRLGYEVQITDPKDGRGHIILSRRPDVIDEEAVSTGLMSYWDMISHYGLDKAARAYHDASIPWINQNDSRSINRLLRNPDMINVGRLKLFFDKMLDSDGATPEMFEEALNKEITVWRGGGGVYDPAHPIHPANRKWVSFSCERGRMDTFTKYHATHAMNAFRLPERKGPWWIVELTIPLRNVLLYLPHGVDHEVIVSLKDAKNAKLVETGGDVPTDQ